MTQYTFKRGKVRSRETWTLSDTALSRDGETIALSDVTEVMFVQTSSGRLWVTVLKLTTPEKAHTLQCNGTFKSADRQQFVALCADTISKLKTTGSSAIVKQSASDKFARWIFAAIGLGMLIAGLYWLISLVSDDSAMLGLILGGTFIAVGGFCIWGASPWKSAPEQDLPALHQQLANIQNAMRG